MEEERDIFKILEIVTNYLSKEDIPYMLVGGVTLAYIGAARSTEDIDILIMLEEKKIRKFVEFMEKNSFSVNEEDIKEAIKEKSHFSIFDNKSVFRVDVKGIYDELDKDSFSRRKKINLRGLNVYINTPEDAIISKLIYGSPRDLDDAKSIIFRQKKKLDFDYMNKKCRKHNVLEKLEKIMK